MDINLDDSKESYQAVLAFAKGERIPILSLTGSGGTITNEVQKDWISKRKEDTNSTGKDGEGMIWSGGANSMMPGH